MGMLKKTETPQLNFFATVIEKQCKRCKAIKPASHFGPRLKNRDGLREWCNQCGSEYQNKQYRSNLEENRKRKRDFMAKARLDPNKREAMKVNGRAYYKANKDKIRTQQKTKYDRRFFWARSHHLKGITARQLASLWKKQRGKCAYTGHKLNRDAHVDHIIPRILGGSDELSNLQWVCPAVNYAKRDLTHEQFIDLCLDVTNWIGKRIKAAEDASK
jgi:5-methylcytosine-specific restriction endonuclease McrA